MNRTLMRVGALAGAATLATVTAAPGYAATVSKATASAITIDVAGQGAQDSGKVTATNDGSGQQKSGMSQPPGPAVPTNGAIDLGLLAQDAEARVVDGQGLSAACAGIVGEDGAVLQLGDGFCLRAGDDAALDLSLGALQPPDELGPGQEQVQGIVEQVLGGATGSEGSDDTSSGATDLGERVTGRSSSDSDSGGSPDLTQDQAEDRAQDQTQDQGQDGSGLRDQLEQNAPSGEASSAQPSSATSQGYTTQNASYQPAAAEELPVDMLTGAIQDALDQLNDATGEFGISGSAGVIQAICSAGPGLSGDANLANAGFKAEGLGQEVGLLSLPADPEPNTHLTTDLSAVLDLIIEDLRANLNEELSMVGDALTQVEKQTAINDVVGQVQSQLGPLEQNVLDVTLNKQTRSNGTIHVTALDAQVLPAAKKQLGASLVSLQIGDVSCGTGNVPGPGPGPVAGVTQSNPQVPTVVTSGDQGAPDEGLPAGVVGGILALLGATALVGYRRVLGR